jgi:endonuclease YncB( thermonuclease family)
MRILIAILVLMAVGPGWAAEGMVDQITDGDTLVLGGTSFRLDGIDAPERDQVCLDENGAVWACGTGARNRLTELTAKRAIRCEDKGPDHAYPNSRHIGICSVDGDATTLNQQLVREGWAVNFEPYAKGRFKADEDDALANRRGQWKGCFATPRDFRRWNKGTAKMLGSTCSTGNDTPERDKLFPDDPAMPSGCSIKGKVSLRAQLTGNRGIYHMEGCRDYQRTKHPNRWFCSEEEAKAAGFRKAFTCR